MITPAQLLKNRIRETQLAADAANASASTLVGIVLDKYSSMTSEASIIRRAATLLQHTAQNFNRVALNHLKEKNECRMTPDHFRVHFSPARSHYFER
tara:strand:+ start:382 stop:672 length:291 start_codon:yes stop_codon:yes gene_type:complete